MRITRYNKSTNTYVISKHVFFLTVQPNLLQTKKFIPTLSRCRYSKYTAEATIENTITTPKQYPYCTIRFSFIDILNKMFVVSYFITSFRSNIQIASSNNARFLKNYTRSFIAFHSD